MASMTIHVAFQGELGAYSEEAVRRYWPGDGTEPVPRRSCADVVSAVEDGTADFGLLPIENSLAGIVVATYDALSGSRGTSVVGETVLPIHHCLLALPGATLQGVKRVASHPVALAQCGRFLREHGSLEAEPAYDTAGAARDLSRSGDSSRAAIAGRGAARRFGLEILAADIEDRPDNQTRFLALGREPAVLPPGIDARTTILASTMNAPAALRRLLDPVADAGLNLSKLDSRPTGKPWSYSFFLEFEHRSDEPMLPHVLDEMARCSESFRVLGHFERAPVVESTDQAGQAAGQGARSFGDVSFWGSDL